MLHHSAALGRRRRVCLPPAQRDAFWEIGMLPEQIDDGLQQIFGRLPGSALHRKQFGSALVHAGYG